MERRDVTPEEYRAMSADDKTELIEKSPFLKAHMRNGELFVLQSWTASGGGVSGEGTRYDTARNPVATGSFHLHVDSVAVFETNHVQASSAAGFITLLAVVTVAVAVMCLVNPKNCFGSCPTFYLAGHERPVAEGFSASIAPSLEATDVDALDASTVGAGRFDVVMKNEAYETHVVRHVNLLAFPVRDGARIAQALDGTFWSARQWNAPLAARGPEGDCAQALRAADGVERYSLADSTNLAAKETIELSFANPRAGRSGFVIGSRQTLLSTYLLYQTFAYMGRDAGHWIAELERGKLGDAGNALIERLGGIELSIESEPGVWTEVGEVLEFGPIAIDQHMVAFDAPASWTGRARVHMTKGAWRIDNIMLASLDTPVEPIRLAPREVLKDGAADANALALLTDPAQALTTLPGDTYALVYDLPRENDTYQVFLESRGYYLEWMREEWMHEENPAFLAELFFDPDAALKRLAPEFKRVEPGMEQAFWGSRYAKP